MQKNGDQSLNLVQMVKHWHLVHMIQEFICTTQLTIFIPKEPFVRGIHPILLLLILQVILEIFNPLVALMNSCIGQLVGTE